MYIQMYSIHGLVRGQSIEMGRDADTGGQVRYVIELARKLCEFPQVEQVDLFTRRVRDRRVSDDYGKDSESLGKNCRLVRIPCGGGRYIRKERLWPHLDEFVDGVIAFTRRQGRQPTIVHGHYADGGYVAAQVADAFDVPFVFTGHSLGKPKLEYLLREGWTEEKANEELAIERRIGVEQQCLQAADLVIASTRHERDTQYSEYAKREDLPVEIVPPGTDLERFFPYYDYELPGVEICEQFKQARVRMIHEFERFFHFHQDKPLLLAVCRPDRRKNIQSLIKAYGESPQLQAIANLAVFAGIRKDIESMPDNEREVLTDILLLMDRYDLYGKLAIPKNHDSEFEVPELYRLAAASRGVFVNPAFIELFGLTAIEAAATGLPFVATENGGPMDIVANCASGVTVDTTDQEALTAALIESLTDQEKWQERSINGINRVREHYSWQAHCERYLELIKPLAGGNTTSPVLRSSSGRRLSEIESLLVTDLDTDLLRDADALAELLDVLRLHRDRIGLGVTTGRSAELTRAELTEAGIESPDVVIACVGTEIYYGSQFAEDRGWTSRLRRGWRPDALRKQLDALGCLKLQDRDDAQTEFKLSYELVGDTPPEEAERAIRESLDTVGVPYTLAISHERLVDVLPRRASKGKAIRFLASKWNIPLERIAVAGESRSDVGMLDGPTKAIVLGDPAPELERLADSGKTPLYFAQRSGAAGILQGLRHYRMIGSVPTAVA